MTKANLRRVEETSKTQALGSTSKHLLFLPSLIALLVKEAERQSERPFANPRRSDPP